MNIKIDEAVAAVEQLLSAMGADVTHEPYKGTPERYVRFLVEMFGDEPKVMKTFPESYDGEIAIVEHEAWSLCPHHLLPIRFSVDLSYKPRCTPDGCSMVLGLSKLPRLIDQVVREGPALQEKMTQRIVERLSEHADYVRCVVRGEHLCAKMRGVKSKGIMVTSASYLRPSPGLSTQAPPLGD